MAASLIRHEQIVTTLPKAKNLKRVIDKYITLAKRGDLNPRRLAAARLGDEDMVKKLFDTLAPCYKNRAGGYSRVVKAGSRYGDSAPRAVIELPIATTPVKGAEDKARHAEELKRRQPRPTPRLLATDDQNRRRWAEWLAGFFISGLDAAGCFPRRSHPRRASAGASSVIWKNARSRRSSTSGPHEEGADLVGGDRIVVPDRPSADRCGPVSSMTLSRSAAM